MTRYAVGDIQGCLEPLKCLLNRVSFNPYHDQLWLTGDLINRGPQSLETLRFIKQLGTCVRIVLGNHDLHFLAVAYGTVEQSRSDTLTAILDAPDCDELVQWLRLQPLLYSDTSNNFSMSHAGIPPIWSLSEAHKYASEVENVLRGPHIKSFLNTMYGNKPDCWSSNLTGWDRLRVITNYFTRMRFCDVNGKLNFTNKKDTIDTLGFGPWFSFTKRKTLNNSLIFGHWASLRGKVSVPDVYALDTGCVWGGKMTMMNIDTRDFYTCECN